MDDFQKLKRDLIMCEMCIRDSHTSDHGYVIHGYDMGKDFTFTSYWYAISQNGNIYDEILCQYDYVNN